MLSKALEIKGLFLVLLFVVSIGISEGLPKFVCLGHEFATITKLYNNSFFVSDEGVGRYWHNLKEDTLFSYHFDMMIKKNGLVKSLTSSQLYIKSFEATFKTNFNGKCTVVAEQLFGIGPLGGNSNSARGMVFYDSKWSDVVPFTAQDVNSHPVLKEVFSHLEPKQRIKAILNFHIKGKGIGMLFIQGQKLFYLYCGPNDWQLMAENVTQDVLIFENDYKVNFGQIFGGYVDQEYHILYLFGGQITSQLKLIRKFVHKCDIKYETSGKPSKIGLKCQKLVLKSYCKPPEVGEKEDKPETDWYFYANIIVGVVLALMLIVLAFLCFQRCKTHERETVKEEFPLKPIRQRRLAKNRERVFGETPSKGTDVKGLARVRTNKFSTKR